MKLKALRTIWDLSTPPCEEWIASGWFPIETYVGGAVLRPHVLYGPVAMERRGDAWIMTTLCHSFPIDAFEPYWKPLPNYPKRKQPEEAANA